MHQTVSIHSLRNIDRLSQILFLARSVANLQERGFKYSITIIIIIIILSQCPVTNRTADIT